MPKVELVFYRETKGTVPVLDWLSTLEDSVVIKCKAKLNYLQRHGFVLRRPSADYLGNGIYELRILRSGRQYRILYGFFQRRAVLLLSGFTKSERRVPRREIRVAQRRLERFMSSPELHSHVEELG